MLFLFSNINSIHIYIDTHMNKNASANTKLKIIYIPADKNIFFINDILL